MLEAKTPPSDENSGSRGLAAVDIVDGRGRPLTPRHYQAFWAYCAGLKPAEIAKTGNIAVATYWTWKLEPWWKELYKRFVEDRQAEFLTKLMDKNQEVLDGFLDVANSRDAKTASARVQGVKVLAEMGPNPLINRRPHIQITNNTQMNTLNLNPEKYRGMTREELFEYARTGKRPALPETTGEGQ